MNATGILGFWAAFLLFVVVCHLRSWAQNYDLALGVLAAGTQGINVLQASGRDLRSLYTNTAYPDVPIRHVFATCYTPFIT